MSRINRPPVSVSRLAKNMSKDKREGKTAVVVGTITDDVRMMKVPKLKVSTVNKNGWLSTPLVHFRIVLVVSGLWRCPRLNYRLCQCAMTILEV